MTDEKRQKIQDFVDIIRDNILQEPKTQFTTEEELTQIKKFLENILLLWCFRTLIERAILKISEGTPLTAQQILKGIIVDWNEISTLSISHTQTDQLYKHDLDSIFLNLILKKYWTRKNPNSSIQLGLLTDAGRKDTDSVAPSHLSMFILPETLESGKFKTVMTIYLPSAVLTKIKKTQKDGSPIITIDLANKGLLSYRKDISGTTEYPMMVEIKGCLPRRTSTFTLKKETKSTMSGKPSKVIASIASQKLSPIVSNQKDQDEQESIYKQKVATDFSKFSIIPKDYQKSINIDHYLKSDGEPFDSGSQFAKVLSLTKSEIMKMGTKLYKKEKFDIRWLNKQKIDLEAEKEYMKIPQDYLKLVLTSLVSLLTI